MSEPDPIRRVWGIGTPRTLRPHWLLRELDLEYETKPIITRSEGMRFPEFLALSQRAKIPLLEDGRLMIGESAAIALYLADRYRDLGIFAPPRDSDDRARHDELCFFVMSEMDAILYVIRRHEGLAQIYGESKVAAESAREYFLRSAAEIERRLVDGRTHLMGDDFNVADLLLKTCLDWAGFVNIALPDALVAYSEAISTRPAYIAAMQHNFPPAALAALGGPTP